MKNQSHRGYHCLLLRPEYWHTENSQRAYPPAPLTVTTDDEVDLFRKKKYDVSLELSQFTEGQARQSMDYIRTALLRTNCVEIWNVGLLGYWEYDDRPYIRKGTIRMEELTIDDMKEIINATNWDNKDKNRPSLYYQEIIR